MQEQIFLESVLTWIIGGGGGRWGCGLRIYFDPDERGSV